MNHEPQIELLKKVEKVGAPDFLLTRIHAKIRSREAERLPFWWQWAGTVAFFVLLWVNFHVFQTHNRADTTPAESLVSAMHLQNSNQLYYE